MCPSVALLVRECAVSDEGGSDTTGVRRMSRRLIAACGIALFSSVALAGLKEKPPQGVDLAGTWQLDPYRSDDPTAVLDQARGEMQEKGGGGGMRRGGGGGPGGGGAGGGGGFPGGGGGGAGGGGFP